MLDNIRVISFDLDGTLVDPSFLSRVWEYGVPKLYAQRQGIGFERAKAEVVREYQIIGDERVEWYDIKYWFRYFDLGGNWQELLYGFKDEVRAYPEAIQVVESLSKIYPLVITSNATREFIDVELEVSGLKDYFGHVFSATSDFGLVKKTPWVYDNLCDKLEVKPEELLHVGDHWDFDYLTPKSLGINAIFLARQGQQKGDLIVSDLRELEGKLMRP